LEDKNKNNNLSTDKKKNKDRYKKNLGRRWKIGATTEDKKRRETL